jgi:hypothetical protein
MIGRGLARRAFAALLPAGLVAAVARGAPAFAAGQVELLIDALGAPDALATIGRAAERLGAGAGLPTTPAEALAGLIERHSGVAAALQDRGALRRALVEAIREDFAREDVIVVDGWVLARAEVEVALASARAARLA